MQIHELNTFSGTPGASDYLATDNGADTSKIAIKTITDPLNARIDNIIAGPAPSAEEIVDARLGADGITYPSLGDAIRDQFDNLEGDYISVRTGELLEEGTDLFTLPIGQYFSNSTALTTTLSNKPSDVSTGFRLIVYMVSASNRRGMMLWTPTHRLYFTSEGSSGYYEWDRVATYAYVDDSINSINSEDLARFDFEDSYRDRTINLINPSTLTTGYILVNNVPTARANYWYSDYIFIGRHTIYYRDQGASISNLVSCYGKDKNYIGMVDYNSAVGYERITGTEPTNYYKITPLPGTVYIRVNGRYTSNLMLCPYFYPQKYVAYGETYYMDALKVAMFGDSITYGTNGNDHSNPVVQNLPYWVKKITGMVVDNQGVGSMGWVSTQYLTDIAYDKISSVDLSGYDVITLCYGVNDTGAVLGTYDSTDESTIMGQINKCVRYIGAQNPKARIIIIAPWSGASSGATFPKWGYGRTVYYAAVGDTTRTKTRQDLSDAEKELCRVYGLGFIGQEDSPLNGFGLGAADGTTPGPYIGTDLVHPSVDGYKAMGEWLAAKINGIVAFR